MQRFTGEGMQTMLEESPVKDSQSNGFTERAIRVVEGQIRTLKLALEDRIGKKICAGACVMPWLVEHAGNMLTLFEVGGRLNEVHISG